MSILKSLMSNNTLYSGTPEQLIQPLNSPGRANCPAWPETESFGILFGMTSSKDPMLDKRAAISAMNKPIRRINPLGMRVVVRIQAEQNVSDGGLYLPEGAKQNTQESLMAEVLEVASALDARTNEETNVSGIPLGATVLIKKSAGVRVPWDDQLRVVETSEVLAIGSEIELT